MVDFCCVSLVLHYLNDIPCKNCNSIFVFVIVIPKTLLVPFFSGHGVVELVDITASWNLELHSYADDTPIMLHCKPDAVNSHVVSLEKFFDDIRQWMADNRLKLNADKPNFSGLVLAAR